MRTSVLSGTRQVSKEKGVHLDFLVAFCCGTCIEMFANESTVSY